VQQNVTGGGIPCPCPANRWAGWAPRPLLAVHRLGLGHGARARGYTRANYVNHANAPKPAGRGGTPGGQFPTSLGVGPGLHGPHLDQSLRAGVGEVAHEGVCHGPPDNVGDGGAVLRAYFLWVPLLHDQGWEDTVRGFPFIQDQG